MRYGFARRFIAGETLQEALAASAELGRAGRRVSLNHLGENVRTAEEAERAQESYIEMTRQLNAQGMDGNVSIKLTQLGLDLDRDLCQRLTIEIAAAAASLGRTIEIDMEGTAYTDLTLDIFEATRRRLYKLGPGLQAHLLRTEQNIGSLAPLSRQLP